MTLLQKPIKRELPISFDRRNWTVEMHGAYLRLKPKRSRKEFYDVSWDSIIERAIRAAVELRRREKSLAKKAKRAA